MVLELSFLVDVTVLVSLLYGLGSLCLYWLVVVVV